MSPKASGEKVVATNRRARRDDEILDSWECGIMLQGSEVKSLRESKVQLADSYARLQGNEVWLIALHISPYSAASTQGGHELDRTASCCSTAPRSTRFDLGRPGSPHARSALAVLQGRPGEARARARPRTPAVRQAPGHRETRRRTGSSPSHGSRQSRRVIVDARRYSTCPMATRRTQIEPNNRMVLTVLAVIGFGAAVALVGAGSAGHRDAGASPAADTIVTTVAVLVGARCAWLHRVRAATNAPTATTVGESGASAVPFLLHRSSCRCSVTVLLLLFTVLVVGPCLNKKTAEPFPPGEQRTTTPNTAPLTDARHKPENRPNWSVVTGFVLGAAGLVLAFAAR